MKNLRPKLSIIIPIHQVKDGDKFLWRSINALTRQSFQDYELIVTQDGSVTHNTNEAIKRSRGELIKILHLDDQLAHQHALKTIVERFMGHWLMTGTDNNPYPYWTDDIETGNNKLGSPSALTILNDNPLLFDENTCWMHDCDYYRRMYDLYGEPLIVDGEEVIMGIGEHQLTNTLTDEQKLAEVNYLKQKYEYPK